MAVRSRTKADLVIQELKYATGNEPIFLELDLSSFVSINPIESLCLDQLVNFGGSDPCEDFLFKDWSDKIGSKGVYLQTFIKACEGCWPVALKWDSYARIAANPAAPAIADPGVRKGYFMPKQSWNWPS